MQKGRMTTASTGCVTCKDHAIACDYARPSCLNCSRSNRKCQWYSLRLSWPRANDHRRAAVSKSSPHSRPLPTAGKISGARFVHISHWDFELYHKLTSPVPVRILSLRDVPITWNPSKLKTLDQDLLEHFCCEASTSLANFGQDAKALGKILVRIALGEETASGLAALQALLAFASLHRYGLQSQAFELKIAALGSLAKGSSTPRLGVKETLQHIVTGMLLCSFEVHQSSCTSGQWKQYVEGVKTVIKESSVKTLLEFDSDVAVLLDWVHYNDVLARFSEIHWKKEGAPDLLPVPTDFFVSQVSNLPPPIFSILDLLSQVCDVVSISSSQLEKCDDHDSCKSFVEVLDWRIRSLPMPKVTDDNDDTILVMKLYQLSMLVYLNRISDDIIGQPARTQQQIDQAFDILRRLNSCKQQFPIFIIGCESRTDEQRAIVLDIISRTEKMSSSRSFNHCRGLLQAVWAQDDLSESNNIGYRGKLTSVISYCVILPTFV
ncbi:hypothetical protein ACMFMG_004234 [Clarireedia jacksonii]